MADQWFYRQSGMVGDETQGPLSSEEMTALCREGTIVRDTFVASPQATRGIWVPAATKSLLLREIQNGVNEETVNSSPAREQSPERIVPGSNTPIPWIAVAIFVLFGVVGSNSSAAIVRRFQLAGWKVSAPDFGRAAEASPTRQITAEAKRKQKELQLAISSTPKGWERFCEPDHEIPKLVGKKISPGDMGIVESLLCQKIFPDGTFLAWMGGDGGPTRVKVYGLDQANALTGRAYKVPSNFGFVVGKEVITDAGETFTVPTLKLVDISSVLFRRLHGYGQRLAETDPVSEGVEMVEKATEVTKNLEKLAPSPLDRVGSKGRKKRGE